MEQKTVVLCGASRYEEKYYLNPDFAALPESIRNELQIMCVLYTQEIGGILILEYDEEGSLHFRTEAKENDFDYDEIGSVLRIKELQSEKQELMEALEMYYKVFFLGESYEG
ncbi:MAG: DUF6145 family protein [Candidatus Limivivens sp.]|nr:DUF6145 family protein [Candidatus Limivivens sp.]